MADVNLSSLKSRFGPLLAPGVALAVTTACCGLAFIDPRLAVAGFCAVIMGLVVISSPHLATPMALFLLYSNLTVVAVRFHRVPSVLNLVPPMLLAIPVVTSVMVQRRRLVIHPALSLVVLFLVVQLFGALNARDPDTVKGELVDYVLEGVLIFFLVTNAVRDRKSLRLATWALLFAGFATSLVPTYQQLTNNYKSDFGGLGQTQGEDLGFKTLEGEEQARASATIGEQNRYGQNMLILLPLGYFRYLREKSKRMRALALLLTGVSGIGFLLSFSRGGMLAAALVIALMALMKLLTRRHLMVLGVGAFLTVLALPSVFDRIASFARLTNLENNEVAKSAAPDGAMKGRITEMLAAALVFADHPLLGVGSGMFKFYSQEYGNQLGIRRLEIQRQAHCLYLDIAAENGALGLACFLGVVVMIVRSLLRARAHHLGSAPLHCPDEDATPYLLSVLCYMASGIFLHLSFIRFLFVLLGLAAAAGRIEGPAQVEAPASSLAGSPSFARCAFPPQPPAGGV